MSAAASDGTEDVEGCVTRKIVLTRFKVTHERRVHDSWLPSVGFCLPRLSACIFQGMH